MIEVRQMIEEAANRLGWYLIPVEDMYGKPQWGTIEREDGLRVHIGTIHKLKSLQVYLDVSKFENDGHITNYRRNKIHEDTTFRSARAVSDIMQTVRRVVDNGGERQYNQILMDIEAEKQRVAFAFANLTALAKALKTTVRDVTPSYRSDKLPPVVVVDRPGVDITFEMSYDGKAVSLTGHSGSNKFSFDLMMRLAPVINQWIAEQVATNN